MFRISNKKVTGEKKEPTASAKIGFGSELSFASAEAYNLLRTNLLFSLPKKDAGRVIGITSPCPQEGKSYNSVNLSYSLANNGNKVLLIDADMRRPSIANSLGLPLNPGLSNRLCGNENVVHTAVLHENLTVMTAGDIPPNPSELIGSGIMADVLTEAAKVYDYVIVDLPPVNAVSDALALSHVLDGIVVVVRHGRSHKSDVVTAVRQLKFMRTHILGFVYNAYSFEKSHYYGKNKQYAYGNYYGSQISSGEEKK